MYIYILYMSIYINSVILRKTYCSIIESVWAPKY